MNKIAMIFGIIFLLLNFITYSIYDINKRSQINVELNNSIKDLKLHYDITKYHNIKSADSVAFTLPQNKKIMAILEESLTASEEKKIELRKELYKILEKKFKALKLEGVKIFLFSEPNNRVFLRLHKPDRFGDDVSSVRPAIAYVNKFKKELRGFEQGKFSHAFRNIYPIFNKNGTYLGCFDVSFSSESMKKVLDDVNKIHSHFLVKKEIVNKKVWKIGVFEFGYKQSIEHNDYLISEGKDVKHIRINISKETIKKNKELIDKKIKNSEEFAIVGARNNELIVISFLPIKNIIEDKANAYIVSYTDNEEISKIISYFKLMNIFTFLFIFIVLYLIYKQIMHKKELSIEVAKKTAQLKNLNENLELKIEEETSKNREKDKQIYEHAKNAQMGEMIGNIAHQWRQPLSLINTVTSAQKLKMQLNIENKEDRLKELDLVSDTVLHLSKTIDIFRDYLKDDKKLKKVTLQDRVDYAITIIQASLKNSHIELINEVDYDDKIEVEIVVGELSQVLINIFTNAKDALLSKNIRNKWIKIALYRKENSVIITIEDNAGGIPEDILPKIYDPYFTTKHQSQGTGIGLYMSSQIVQKHLNGKLFVENSEHGAKFFIEIPIK